MYRIKLTKQARKELKSIKKIFQEAIDATFQEIKENPFFGKPLLRELTGKFSYRVGAYRIIYKIHQQDKVITILTIGHRSRVYES